MKISTPVSLFLWIIILGGGFVSIWALVRDATAPRPSVNFPPSKWNELRIGMSKREVEDLLGKPSLASPRPWNGVSSAPHFRPSRHGKRLSFICTGYGG